MKPEMIFYLLLAATLSGEAHTQVPTVGVGSMPTSVASAQVVPPSPEPIVSQFKRTVIFLETDCLTLAPDGTRTVTPYAGTGFLVSHHDPKYPEIGGFSYLVTNRHVALPGIEEKTPCQVVDYKVRLNLKVASADGSLSEVISLGRMVPWIFPADPAIDLAVVPFGPDPARYSILDFPSNLFLSSVEAKAKSLVEGDSVIYTGVFIQFLGQVKVEPIVRAGKIAMIPDESVPTTLRLLGSVYLVDAHVFGGNSGSPMLVNLAGQRDNGLVAGLDYHLLGLISGYVQETSDFKLRAVASYAGTVVANSGVTMVVPAQQILDLLDSDDLQAQRRVMASHLPSAVKR